MGPVVLFHFPAYGLEALFNTPFPWLLVVTILAAAYAVYLLVTDFFNDAPSLGKAWTVVALLAVAVLSDATLRHGMRVALTAPALAQVQASTAKYVNAVEQFRTAAAQAPEAQKVFAAGGEGLADKNGCLVCHSAQEKVVGPAYKDVAGKGYSTAQILALVRSPKPANWPDYPEMPAHAAGPRQ